VRVGVALLFAALLLAAGCGSGPEPVAVKQPQLPRALAGTWRAQADGVAAALAANDGCLAQRRMVTLRTGVIQAINKRRVAPQLQESLLSAVNDLTSRITCVPPVVPAPVQAPAPAAHGPGARHPPHEHGHGHGRGGEKGGGDDKGDD
jgi:hypothetical protein